MKHIIFLAFLFQAYLGYAEENDNAMVIDSDVAGYNGSAITLSGHVTIEHDLGILKAEKMELTPELNDKRILAKLLTLDEDVKIELKDGGQLCCSSAKFDFQTHQGTFKGNTEKEYVTYTELCENKSEIKVPIVVKSKEMSVRIARDTNSSNPKNVISQISAVREVTVNYNDDFMAAADHAEYHRSEQTHSGHMPGVISLRCDGEEGVCQITNRNGDIITADNFCIDTTERQLCFAYPKGALKTLNTRIDFSSDTLTWDDLRNILTLREHVNIHQPGLGSIVTDKDVKLTQESQEGKKKLCTIESTGITILTYVEEEKDISHALTSYGPVCVDHKNLVTIMESPRDTEGNVLPDKQVFFQDYMGEIFADKLTIHYVMQDYAMKPFKLFLEGHVKMLSRCAVDPDCKGDFLQYALADTVEYTPQAKEIQLKANKENRVLFYDKVNNLQVSAPALKIRRDEATKKESIQGMGNVRFTFLKQEFDTITKQFQINPEGEKK